jgi:hypothetical protein
MTYAARRVTMNIFHFGGALTAFILGSVNHVSIPVALS